MTSPETHLRVEFVGGPMGGTTREFDFLPLTVAVCERQGFVGTASGLSLDKPDVVVHEYAVDDAADERGIYFARHTKR